MLPNYDPLGGLRRLSKGSGLDKSFLGEDGKKCRNTLFLEAYERGLNVTNYIW